MQVLPSHSALPSGTNPSRPVAARRFTAAKLLLPLAAALFLALFSVSMVMNLQASSRMDQLEVASTTVAVQMDQLEDASTAVAVQMDQAMAQTKKMEEENAVLVERLDQLPADGKELVDTVQQIRAASFLMAHPDTQPMILEPPSGTGNSNGVLLVGEGGSGKTQLLRRLRGEGFELQSESTHGIEVRELLLEHPSKPDVEMVLNCWDFGGQQIYHAIHQFFLTKNSLYILLDDTAKDHKLVTDEGFRYWLEIIELLSD